METECHTTTELFISINITYAWSWSSTYFQAIYRCGARRGSVIAQQVCYPSPSCENRGLLWLTSFAWFGEMSWRRGGPEGMPVDTERRCRLAILSSKHAHRIGFKSLSANQLMRCPRSAAATRCFHYHHARYIFRYEMILRSVVHGNHTSRTLPPTKHPLRLVGFIDIVAQAREFFLSPPKSTPITFLSPVRSDVNANGGLSWRRGFWR